jgi:hypothetical protein
MTSGILLASTTITSATGGNFEKPTLRTCEFNKNTVDRLAYQLTSGICSSVEKPIASINCLIMMLDVEMQSSQ